MASEMANVGGGTLGHRWSSSGQRPQGDTRRGTSSLEAGFKNKTETNKQKKIPTKQNSPALPGASSGKIKVGCKLPDPILPVHFLQFHPPILKPDFHLSVREVDAAADL